MGIETLVDEEQLQESDTLADDLSALRAEVISHKEAFSSQLGDMTYLAEVYPKEAWAKNNNPSGITFQDMSPELIKDLGTANIYFEKGTARPRNEKKNYVRFVTMDEGMRAQELMLKRGDQIIRNRLMQRVGNGGKDGEQKNAAYATVVLKNAGIINGERRFSSLTSTEMKNLVLAQIMQESPSLYKEIRAKNIVIPKPGSNIIFA